jgi:hypothetical protein
VSGLRAIPEPERVRTTSAVVSAKVSCPVATASAGAVTADVHLAAGKPTRAVAVVDQQRAQPAVGDHEIELVVAVHVPGGDARRGPERAGQQRGGEGFAGDGFRSDVDVIQNNDRRSAGRVADEIEDEHGRRPRSQAADVERDAAAVECDASRLADGATGVEVEERRCLRPEGGHE